MSTKLESGGGGIFLTAAVFGYTFIDTWHLREE
jgi:hypothetical protein